MEYLQAELCQSTQNAFHASSGVSTGAGLPDLMDRPLPDGSNAETREVKFPRGRRCRRHRVFCTS